MAGGIDRRSFLVGAGAGALGAALATGGLAAGTARADDEKDGGGKGGGSEDIPEPKRVNELRPRPLKPALLQGTNGISAKTHEAHHKLYEKYVESANRIFKVLTAGGVDPAAMRALKLDLSFQLNGVKNHTIYFDNLGGTGQKPEGRLLKYLERDFGGVDKWEADLRATALGARGWVWLAFDFTTNRLFNFIGDAQNEYPVWDAAPVLALDMYEHAYWADFLTDKGAYLD
ncbi:MAG TPA: Fe-Mn family superoxide dismutase, partial [Planctomycetota bacterium]|nr:Fe-Mn family superoxide dismutase [Planctomycetota bacterium]